MVAAVDVARAGNPSASTDVGVAVELLTAALRGAALNVGVNIKGMDDTGYVSAIVDEMGGLRGVDGFARRGGAYGRQLSVITLMWTLNSQWGV